MENDNVNSKKKDELPTCCACLGKQSNTNKGLVCPQGHFLCSKVRGDESCASFFVRTVLTDDEMRLCDTSEGSFQIKCADCKVHFDLTKLEKFVPAELNETFLTNIAIYTMEKGDVWLSCPLCSSGTVYQQHNDIFLECFKDLCRKTSCRLCLKDVHKDRIHHLTVCFPLFGPYQSISEAIEKAQLATCPHCGLCGMKNTSCCEITCSRCEKWWCYACGSPQEECERDIEQSLTTHLWSNQWKTNQKRCPHYLEQYSAKNECPDNAKEALSWFHEKIYLARLKKLFNEVGLEVIRCLLVVKPQLLGNDTIDVISSYSFPHYLKRGRYSGLV